MTRQELVDIVMSGISEQFGIGRQSLSETTVAADVAGWDSFPTASCCSKLKRD